MESKVREVTTFLLSGSSPLYFSALQEYLVRSTGSIIGISRTWMLSQRASQSLYMYYISEPVRLKRSRENVCALPLSNPHELMMYSTKGIKRINQILDIISTCFFFDWLNYNKLSHGCQEVLALLHKNKFTYTDFACGCRLGLLDKVTSDITSSSIEKKSQLLSSGPSL